MTAAVAGTGNWSITRLAQALEKKELSSEELTGAALDSIDTWEPALHAYLSQMREHALDSARASDRARLADEKVSLLSGIPIALKDVLCLENQPVTAGSRLLEGFTSPYTATAVARLKAAGMVFVGKTNCDEFAMGSSTENSGYGPTGNPWDPACSPGGSSGGSAATVAARSVPCSLGTDTGGSIRQPASLCGVVGFKPTYGRVSRYGLIAFASSLDQIGPFTRRVEDAALLYREMAGADPMDSTTLSDPVEDPVPQLSAGVAGLRLGVPREYMGSALSPGVRAAVEAAIALYQEQGAIIEEVSLPSTDLGLSTYYVIAPAECSSNLARFDGVRYGNRLPSELAPLTEMYLETRRKGFGPEVKRRIMLGTYVLSHGYYDAYYRKAQQVRSLIANEFSTVFSKVDALIAPTSPSVAFPLGAKSDALSMYMCDVLTVPVNLAGLPGISIPCGFEDGLPVGLQVIGPRLADAMVLRVAHAYEEASGWKDEAPKLPHTLTTGEAL